MVTELLHRLIIDNGFPITTEPSMLSDLVKPPPGVVISTTSKKIVVQKGNIGKLNGISSSNSNELAVDWRKPNIVHSKNEIYFDVIENLDCIVDNNGMVVSSEVNGRILANCRLSAMPDVTLHFRDSEIIDDCSFHHW
jgi:AP-3 complex subunit mu